MKLVHPAICLSGMMYDTDFMIMGITESNDGDVSGNHGGSDLWFLKMFQNRTIAWQKCLGGSGNETGYDSSPEFESTQDGGYLLSGYTESNDGDVSGNHGGGDTWIVKLNSNREIEWQKCIGGSASDSKWFINEITNNRIRVRGSTFSQDGDMIGSHGNKDFWIATLFTNGTIESVTCLGGSGDESVPIRISTVRWIWKRLFLPAIPLMGMSREIMGVMISGWFH